MSVECVVELFPNYVHWMTSCHAIWIMRMRFWVPQGQSIMAGVAQILTWATCPMMPWCQRLPKPFFMQEAAPPWKEAGSVSRKMSEAALSFSLFFWLPLWLMASQVLPEERGVRGLLAGASWPQGVKHLVVVNRILAIIEKIQHSVKHMKWIVPCHTVGGLFCCSLCGLAQG